MNTSIEETRRQSINTYLDKIFNDDEVASLDRCQGRALVLTTARVWSLLPVTSSNQESSRKI